MKNIKNRIKRTGTLYLCLLSGASYADDSVVTSLQRLSQSSQLAEYGRSTNNAAALIVAAQMRRELAGELREKTMLRHSSKSVSIRDSEKLPSVENLLAEARTMGRGDPIINNLADNVASTSEKGRERGPLYEIINVSGGKTEKLKEMAFNLEKRVEIYAEGTENLSLVVLDATGHSICSDDRNWKVAYCWWPRGSATSVIIEVTNKSADVNTIRLVTN